MDKYSESIDYYHKPCHHAPNKPNTMGDEPKDVHDAKGKGKPVAVVDHHGGAADHQEPESQEDSFFSDSESGSESIEIADLKKRMWKDQLLLMRLEGRSGRDRAHHGGADDHHHSAAPTAALLVHQQQASKEHAGESPESRYRRKAMLRAQDGVIRHMLKMMEACNARGFVYGVVDEAGVPVSGSSDSLRGWWKDEVGFDRAGPLALSVSADAAGLEEKDSPAGSPMAAAAASFLHGLHDIQDSTLGSLLSALIQHCEPPQRSFPLDRGQAPPWWPTGREPWWGAQGAAAAGQGPPPYRKPHDLKKAWKVSLLSAVIKHLAPRFDQMRRLVWQSKRLQHKMSARDADAWAKVITHEEALDRHAQRTLRIAPLDLDHGEEEEDDDDGGPDDDAGGDSPVAAAQHVEKRKRKVGGVVDVGKELLLALPDIDCVPDADRSSIDELMKLYYRCLQGTDDGEHEAKGAVAAAVVPDRGQQHSGVAISVTVTTQAAAPVAHDSMLQGGLQRGCGTTAPDGSAPAAVHVHEDDDDDDMLHNLLGIADVVDMSDFPNSPIWQWGFYD